MSDELLKELKRATVSEESLKEKLEIAEIALGHIVLHGGIVGDLAKNALEEMEKITSETC